MDVPVPLAPPPKVVLTEGRSEGTRTMPSPAVEGQRGFLIPIGGAEDKVSARSILSRFTEICGGRDARLVVIPTASQLDDTGARYREIFGAVGAGRVTVLELLHREDGERSEAVEAIQDCTGVFMTGGNQLRLSTILGGTSVARAIRRANARGAAVAGTSAGAAFISEHMICFGKEGGTPIAGGATLGPGLGLTNRFIVDQHFTQRDRLGRLLSALAYNPFAVGLGLDEDTAAFIGPDHTFQVVGSGSVTVVDTAHLEHSSMATASEGSPVEMIGVRLHILVEGAAFDLGHRRATPAPKSREA
jgi:cyanophycinase